MYTNERAPQILISLLKAYGINTVVASPGTTNMAFIASIQKDPFFNIYSSVDERSAAYIACGIAAESGKPVVISCTGATASRNYMPGLTEAFYRKLPILAVTSTTVMETNGHLIAQKIDRSVSPNDVYCFKTELRIIHSQHEEWLANVNVNKALSALTYRGGGPVHINLETDYSNRYEVETLPEERVIRRISLSDVFPTIKEGHKVGIFVGSHKTISHELETAIDNFCARYDAVVLCDITSGYHGNYKVESSLICAQSGRTNLRMFDVLIHIGEVSGDYYSVRLSPKEVWRVSPDGSIRDYWHTLRYIFDMEEIDFFNHFSLSENKNNRQLKVCKQEAAEIIESIPELPFSHIWIAQHTASKFPENCLIHFGILNSLRSWNFFPISKTIETNCNVGGFGIDGIMSTLIGASLASPNKICYAVLGDLAFFYDLNSIANRHVGSNIRILMVNNGRGTEFTNYSHPGYVLGEDAVPFVAAAGHYGNKSNKLVKHFAEDLGFEYLTASNKEEYLAAMERFVTSDMTDRPMLFEVFTDSKDESDALEIMLNLKPTDSQHSTSVTSKIKAGIKAAIGEKGMKIIKILKE